MAVTSYSTHWPCLIPQAGPGRKHERSIELQDWQQRVALDGHPDQLLRGLLHSDGCRVINRIRKTTKTHEYVRYQFSNRSMDIHAIFWAACQRLDVEFRFTPPWTTIVSRRDSVAKLETTARALRPAVPSVNTLVSRLNPLLSRAQPLMKNLRPLLREARPTVRRLVPVAKQATGVLDDLHGPVLDRVNGPVAKFVLNPWKGTGPYAGGTDNYMKNHKFYEELAYMATNVDRASMMQDQYGSTLAFQVGAAANSLDGLPFDLDSLVQLGLKSVYGITSPAEQKSILKKAGLK